MKLAGRRYPRLTGQDVSRMEGLVPREYGKNAVEIPGARDLLASLNVGNAPWAIVTSGTRPLVNGWMDVMKLARPKHMVTAEDVAVGKPGESRDRRTEIRVDLTRNGSRSRMLFARKGTSIPVTRCQRKHYCCRRCTSWCASRSRCWV